MWGFLQSLRPFWWLVRAWIAVELIDLVWGHGGYMKGLDVIPSLRWAGFPLLVAALVISVQIGRERLWPAPRRGMSRAALLVPNLFALALVPVVVDNLVTTAKVDQWYGGYLTGANHQEPGLWLKDRPVRNIYPYDAAGQPLVGVRLVDENGRRLDADGGADECGSPRTCRG
ncbi:MAG: hypothetical protein JWN68_837 [Nocardioides sp.]|uniref:hypothetical protein n=1 Tax=Nocardioides sp. TaxID=35761 RepID=UPI00260C4692|nr:hypothetical protein [Nocardioides sp.]MCW2832884.1 hypothetical protein [Nocardioides sp.]